MHCVTSGIDKLAGNEAVAGICLYCDKAVLQENKANDKRTGMSVESGWYFQPLSCTIRER